LNARVVRKKARTMRCTWRGFFFILSVVAGDQGLDAQVGADRYVQKIDAFVAVKAPLDAVKQRPDGE
jgi:methylglyoxal synthase